MEFSPDSQLTFQASIIDLRIETHFVNHYNVTDAFNKKPYLCDFNKSDIDRNN